MGIHNSSSLVKTSTTDKKIKHSLDSTYGYRLARSRSYRDSTPLKRTIFLPSVLGSQKRRENETNHRFKDPKQFYSQEVDQNANYQVCNEIYPATRMGLQDRSTGRILSCTNSSSVSEVPGFPYGRKVLLFHQTPFWPNCSSMGVFTGHKASQRLYTQEGSELSFLPRRFPNSPQRSGVPQVSGVSYTRVLNQPRSTDKHIQVSINSNETNRVSGDSLRPLEVVRGSYHQKDSTNSREGERLSYERVVLQETTGIAGGTPELCSPLLGTGTTSPSAVTMLPQRNEVCFEGCSGVRSGGASDTSINLVGSVRAREIGTYESGGRESTSSGSNDRFLGLGLGRLPGQSPSSRVLVSPLARSPYQPERAENYSLVPREISGDLTGSVCGSLHRQFGSSEMLNQPKIIEVSSVKSCNSRDTSVCGPLEDQPCNTSHSGPSERSCGLTVEIQSFDSRMDTESVSVLPGRIGMGTVRGRPIRDKSEQENESICFPLSGPSSTGGQCDNNQLGQVEENLHVSTSKTPPRGGVKTPELGGRGRGDCPLVSTSPLVSESSSQSETLPSSPNSGGLTRPVRTGRVGVTQQSLGPQTTRVGLITERLKLSGFGDESIELILKAHKDSTKRQYQSAWNKFIHFIFTNPCKPKSINLATVLGFLSMLHFHEKKAYRTIQVYRNALKFPLLLSFDLDLDSPVTAEYFRKGLFLNRPPIKCKELPEWSLDSLLLYLSSSTFSDTNTLAKELLLGKTLCLALLATGRRVSNICAFSKCFRKRTQHLVFPVIKGFVLKNESEKFYASDSLIYELPQSVGDSSLCPLKAMYNLHYRRKEFTGVDMDEVTNFFVDFKSKLGLTPARARLLLKKMITNSRLDEGLDSKIQMGPHGFRKLAASYSILAGHEEKTIRENMGFSSLTILHKNYVFQVEPLSVSCVVPGGTYNKMG